jgi:hypothetical protein
VTSFNFPFGRPPCIDRKSNAAWGLGKSRLSDNLQGGLVAVCFPGVGMVDIISGRPGATLGTATVFRPHATLGVCMDGILAGNGGARFIGGGSDFAGKSIILAAIIIAGSISNGWYSQPIMSWGGNKWFSVNEGGSGGNAGLLSQTVAGVTVINSTVRITANDPWFVLAVSNDPSSAGFWLARNMKTGQVLIDTTSGNIPMTGDNTQNFTIGNNNAIDNAWEGQIAAVSMTVNRGMTLAEGMKWSEDPWSFWYAKPYRPAVALSTIPLAYLRVDADDSVGEWTNQSGGASNLWDSIDEASASDADYVQSPFKTDGYSSTSAKFRLSNPVAGRTMADPVKIRYRFRKTGSGTKSLVVVLLQGTTTVASWTHTGGGLTESFQTVTQTLTAPQVAAITDFDNLFIRFDDVEV